MKLIILFSYDTANMKIIFGSSAIYLLNHIMKYLNPYIYVFKCMHKYTYAPLAFDQYGFTYVGSLICGFFSIINVIVLPDRWLLEFLDLELLI